MIRSHWFFPLWRGADQWATRLRKSSVEARAYHAGMGPAERDDALAEFQQADQSLLVATSTFAMGMDRADVGLVLHLESPGER